MVRRAAALLTAGLLLVGCTPRTEPVDNAPLVTPSASGTGTDTVTELEYTEVPAGPFRLDGQTGHAFASSDGVTECRVQVTGTGTSGQCVSAATAQEEATLIVFDEQQDRHGEFSADAGTAPSQPPGVAVGRLAPGEMIRLGTVVCLSPAEGSLACLSSETGDGFRLTGHRYDTFHRGGERFGL